ncbi:MAG: response regulator transcription factor [Chloroflexi bacterium]|nr:response regulator transcription factor [Chloroflexota bacterium]
MPPEISVAILDDHQSIIDGYMFRLNQTPGINIVFTARFGNELESMLVNHPVEVLLMDVQVPTAPDNANPYPILHLIPKLLQVYPDLHIIVISMHNQSTLIKAVMEAGASGYLLKDDQASIQELGNIVMAIAKGGIHLSQQAYQKLYKKLSKESTLTARQLEALSLCAAYPDETTAELAKRLEVANSTFRNLLSKTYITLGVRNRTSAIAEARRMGVVNPIENMPEL